MLWLLLSDWLRRPNVMRVLCVVVVIGWVFGPLAAICVTLSLMFSDVAAPLPAPIMWVAFAMFSSVVVATMLLYLPTCGRCSRRLFSEARRQLLRPERPQDRDYRAKQFLWSYRNGAILDMARSGQMRCQWCGHRVGESPDYVVSSSK